MERFGSVYLSRTSGTEELILLEGTLFSNLNFEWRTPEGSRHPEMELYSKHEFWLQSSVTALNRDNQLETYTIKLVLPGSLKFGAYSGPTEKYFQKFCAMEQKMAEELNILDSNDAAELARFARSQGVMAFLPGAQRSNFSSLLPLFLSMWMHADDLLDESDDLVSRSVSADLRQLNYSQLRRIMSPLLATLSQKPITVNETPKFALSLASEITSMNPQNFKRLQRFLNGMTAVLKKWKEETVCCAGGVEAASPLLSYIYTMYEADVFELCTEAQEVNVSLKAAIGRRTCGILMITETAALLEGVILSPVVRSSVLFQWWLEQISNHAYKINDLLSYPKERIVGHGKEVYTRHMTVGGLSLQNAVDMVCREANQSMRNAVEGARLLKAAWKDTPDIVAVNKYVDLGLHALVAILQLAGCQPRYQKKSMVWNCIVKTSKSDSSS